MLTLLNESLEICHNTENYQLMVFNYLNKAQFYVEVGDSRNATEFCTRALEIITYLKTPVGLAKASQLYATIFTNYHQFKIAAQFYEESLMLYQEFKIPLGFANCCSEYAEMLAGQEKINEAIKHFKMAQDIFEELELFNYAEELEQTLTSPQFSTKVKSVQEILIPASA